MNKKPIFTPLCMAKEDMMNNFFPNSRALNTKEHFHLSEKKIFFLFQPKRRKRKQIQDFRVNRLKGFQQQ